MAVVTEIYAAREQPVPGVSGVLVAEAARAAGADVHFAPQRAAVGKLVLSLLAPGDVLLTLGAGDITKLGPELAAGLRAG
jgi:UDP-N-acetylmuramate--alanine ligase